jgi:hypothetical protein
MRRASLITLLAVSTLPGLAEAQLPGADLTGSIAASVGAPISCENCGDLGVHTMLGVVIRDRIGVGYRGLRWGDQSLASDHRMSTDLIAVDFFLPTTGRLRPFLSGGGGHSSVKLMNVFNSGHSHSNYGPASSLRTSFWGVGLDVRLLSRFALMAMLSSTTTNGANSPAEDCSQPNYLSGDFTYICRGRTGQKYRVGGLSIGVGVR